LRSRFRLDPEQRRGLRLVPLHVGDERLRRLALEEELDSLLGSALTTA